VVGISPVEKRLCRRTAAIPRGEVLRPCLISLRACGESPMERPMPDRLQPRDSRVAIFSAHVFMPELWHPIGESQLHPITLSHNHSTMTIGERIKKARKARNNMKRTELSQATGIPYPTLAGIENGDQESSTQLHNIAKALGVRVEWLEKGKGSMEGPEASPGGVSQSLRLDPEKLAETAKALRERYEEAGLVFSIEEDPETFAIAYGYRVEMSDAYSPSEERAFGMKIADLTPQGAVSNERGKRVPSKGTTERKDGEARRQKA